MKRLLFCLVALIAVVALVVPSYAAEMKINGMNHIRAISSNNYNGDDDTDDSFNYVTQRFRMYFTSIASENLKLVYKNEIDFEWGDSAATVARNQGGGVRADSINLETKNVYLEMMVPDTPVKGTFGLQSVTLHEGWFFSNDVSAARFDMNFDPMTITAYWAGVAGLDNNDPDSFDDVWQIVVSSAYKAENMDARLSLGYERGAQGQVFADFDDPTQTAEVTDNDFYLAMAEFGMSFDLVSFDIIAGINFGEKKFEDQGDLDYKGYMFQGKVSVALDMATLRAKFIYASGDDEEIVTDGEGNVQSIGEDNFRGMSGMAVSWGPEILTNGYFYNQDALLNQIGGAPGGDESPNNLWAVGVGADFKPTDTTTISIDGYYMGMVEKRTVGGDEEDEIGIEFDARLAQKVYDNLTFNVVGAYLFAEDGYGTYLADNSGDDAYTVGIGLDYKF
jgi:hypothetical protein